MSEHEPVAGLCRVLASRQEHRVSRDFANSLAIPFFVFSSNCEEFERIERTKKKRKKEKKKERKRKKKKKEEEREKARDSVQNKRCRERK